MSNVLILGGIIIDKYFLMSKYPEIGRDTYIHEAFEIPGGCSLNVAVTLKNLGLTPYIYSKIGSDNEGHIIESYLKDRQLPTELLKASDNQTDYCLVMVDDTGERTFFTYEKNDREISNDYVDKIMDMSFESVYVTGYFMVKTSRSSNKIKLLRRLSDKGVKILFDPGAIVEDIDKEVLKEILKLSDILTPNKFEEEKISDIIGLPFDELINDHAIVFSKDGANELIVKSDDQVMKFNTYKTEVVDTTGAGDSFAAGVLYGLNSKDVEYAAKVGMACGAVTTTFKEPHGRFNIDDIERIIKNGSV